MRILTLAGTAPADRLRHLALWCALLLATVLAAAAPAGAGGRGLIFDPDATPAWTWSWSGAPAASDRANDAVITRAGAVYVCGTGGGVSTYDATLMKLVDGTPAWPAPKRYDGRAGLNDMGGALEQLPDGSFVMGGISQAANGAYDILVVRWSAAGAVKWARTWDGPGHGDDILTGFGADATGNAVACGLAQSATTAGWVVVSWTKSGKKRWTWRWDPPAGTAAQPHGLAVAADGSVYVTGISLTAGVASMVTVRLARDGALLWKKSYKGPEGIAALGSAVVARPGGGAFVAATTMTSATGSDGMVVRYSAKGGRTVFALDPGPGGATDQHLEDVTLTSTGQVVASGQSQAGGDSDAHVAVWTVAGTLAGKLTFPSPAGSDSFSRVEADSMGGFVCAGTFYTAANKTALAVLRGSTLAGGGAIGHQMSIITL